MRCQALIAAVSAVTATAFVPSPPLAGALVTQLRTSQLQSKALTVSAPRGVRCTRTLVRMSSDDERSMVAAGGINVSGEAPFEIRGFSLGTAFLAAGVALTAASFFEYFSNGGAGLSGLGFVYGIPVALIGLALKYAELPPVPCFTSPEADALFETTATETIKKIKNDVTRHRYGDEAHLDSTIKTLGLVVPQSDYPQLQSLKQAVETDGRLSFAMVFQSKDTPYKMWADPKRVAKYNSFFGPGVEASVVKLSSEERLVAIKLVVLRPGETPRAPQAEGEGAVESGGQKAVSSEPAAAEAASA